ncbi:hypothetical protein [Pelagibacterium sp. H642]|uniref:hypothetical protein n=1 Tax=Pelagibacterium sp. H642 TaxID=1881069 RepID=UPI002815AB35|nr:hypothetical protein [Pelagibacterium sp. H642]WMT90174.1 hypothetical protein NO934_15455 [Pelagibacterium sp. H642]
MPYLDLIALRSLPPNARACAMVGGYLQAFALVEWPLSEFIAKGLHANGVAKFVISRHMPMASKVDTARIIAKQLIPRSSPSQSEILDALNGIWKALPFRNVLAHSHFAPGDDCDLEVLALEPREFDFQSQTKYSLEDIDMRAANCIEWREVLMSAAAGFPSHQSRSPILEELLKSQISSED